MALLGVALTACGGDVTNKKDKDTAGSEKPVKNSSCAAINGKTYASETLEEGGRSGALIHWRVDFIDGVMQMYQSDFVLSAKYTCDGDAVIADLGDGGKQRLDFEREYSALYFNPLGGPAITYLPIKTDHADDCSLVEGKRYVEPMPTLKDAIEFAPVFYEFGSGQVVNYTIGGDVLTKGIYDCGMGLLHIHASRDDLEPQKVKVGKEGQVISVATGGGAPLELTWEKTEICTENYAPVCSVALGTIQCVTTPCPAGQYKTFGNYCKSQAADALFIALGECGELEGKPYDPPPQPPVGCTKENKPVCAVKPEQILCKTGPCPTGRYQTYSNACLAKVDLADVVSQGKCGKLEGELYTPPKPPACTDKLAPVCALQPSPIRCITTPCPSGLEYRTFENACLAGESGAKPQFDGKCGDLEGKPYPSETKPPVLCTQEYAPVCGVELGTIQCITTPCPMGQYKTFSNKCTAAAAGALILNSGECGKLEGQPYEKPVDPPPPACTKEYAPICGVKIGGIQCITEPCPIGRYHTYGNKCMLSNDNAKPLFSGECGKLEGQPYEKPEEPICTFEYAPVCGVVVGGIQCITEPCPVGVHKTFGNRCEASGKDTKILFEGKCGELEGQPYPVEPPTACIALYDPVCGTAINNEPCDTVPCPAVVHKTYGNSCEAKVAKSTVLFKGECGKDEGKPISQIEGACPLFYQPVCAKDEAHIACITAPCSTHEYRTFGNQCEANLALATTIFDDACGKLENTLVFGQPPVKIVKELPKVSQKVTVGDARIDKDVLTVELGYSGCSPQHIEFYAGSSFMKSLPVQAMYAFKPLQQEDCDAVFNTKFSYDLIPLKNAYQQSYKTDTGEIVLPGLGRYTF